MLIDKGCLKKIMKKQKNDHIKIQKEVKEDIVNKPAHYNQGKYEVIDIIKDQLSSQLYSPFEGYCLGNIIKYVLRHKYKGGVKDLEKAKWYLNRLIDEDKNGDKIGK